MITEECINFLEDISKFNTNTEEKTYIINKFNNMLKNCNKLINLPETEETFFNSIEDEII